MCFMFLGVLFAFFIGKKVIKISNLVSLELHNVFPFLFVLRLHNATKQLCLQSLVFDFDFAFMTFKEISKIPTGSLEDEFLRTSLIWFLNYIKITKR